MTTRYRGLLCALVFCLTFFISNTDAQDDDAGKASKVKAAYLYNFIKFVKWPDAISPANTHKVSICIMGDNPFGSSLDALKNSLAGKMDMTIISDVADRDVGNCNVLYVSAADAVSGALAAAQRNAVLTVSDMNDFADKGGIIEMKTVEKSVGLFSSNKINLRINVKAAEAAGLRVNAQLLEIAAEVIK